MSVVTRLSTLPRAASLFGRSSSATALRAFSTAKAGAVPVASSDDGAGTTSITVAIKAGPRFESSPGLAHVLKNFTFKSTAKRSALRLVRESELYGGALSAALTKEHLLLTAEFLRGDEDYFVEVLGDVLASSKFQPHEFNEEVLPQVQSEYEQALAQPGVLAFDVLSQVAYRQRGLGASLFASPTAPVSHAATVGFARNAFAQNNVAVVGSGIESARLAELVSKHFSGVSSAGSVAAGASKYFGGEQRIAFVPPHGAEGGRAGHGHVVVAFEGAGLESAAELEVLRAHLGGESNVKWTSGLSPLSKVAEKLPGASAQAFNLSFSDSGLFGIHVSAPHESLQQAAQEAVRALKDASSVGEDDAKRAVAKAKFAAVSALESRSAAHAAVGAQLLSAGKVATSEEAVSKVESVKASALSSAASKLLKSKPTVIAIGNTHLLPYADEVL